VDIFDDSLLLEGVEPVRVNVPFLCCLEALQNEDALFHNEAQAFHLYPRVELLSQLRELVREQLVGHLSPDSNEALRTLLVNRNCHRTQYVAYVKNSSIVLGKILRREYGHVAKKGTNLVHCFQLTAHHLVPVV